jgi:hypothetical protein
MAQWPHEALETKARGDLGCPRDPRSVEVKDKEKTYDKKILAEAWEDAATQR